MINYQRIEEEFLLIFEGWARFCYEWDVSLNHTDHAICDEGGPPMAAEQLYAEWREWA